jgi:hypothetical protein
LGPRAVRCYVLVRLGWSQTCRAALVGAVGLVAWVVERRQETFPSGVMSRLVFLCSHEDSVRLGSQPVDPIAASGNSGSSVRLACGLYLRFLRRERGVFELAEIQHLSSAPGVIDGQVGRMVLAERARKTGCRRAIAKGASALQGASTQNDGRRWREPRLCDLRQLGSPRIKRT